jgi:glutamate-1-semialdehyde 2,1-aminomutase
LLNLLNLLLLLLLVMSALAAVFIRDLLGAVIAFSSYSLVMAIMWQRLQAPDLALTGDARRPTPVPASAGITRGTVDDVVILPFNDLKGTTALLTAHKDTVAAVLVEPILGSCGYVPARPEFLQGARSTKRLGILLIDEVQTFRLSSGGAQALLDIMPDLTVLGKIIGGGLPVGGVGAARCHGRLRRQHRHTKNSTCWNLQRQSVTMRAGLATLQDLDPVVYDHLNQRAATFGCVCKRCAIVITFLYR